MSTDAVVGRKDELEAIAAFVAAARDRPAGLASEGEAGIGKTTLFEAAIASASAGSTRVLACRPAAAEASFAFAALGDLLGATDPEHWSGLPEPQRHALSAALLLEEP